MPATHDGPDAQNKNGVGPLLDVLLQVAGASRSVESGSASQDAYVELQPVHDSLQTQHCSLMPQQRNHKHSCSILSQLWL